MPGGRRLAISERFTLAAEIVATYFQARWWLLRRPFPASVATARAVARPSPPPADEPGVPETARRLGNAAARTLRTLPLDSRCLVTAHVLTRMLARRGIQSTFVI